MAEEEEEGVSWWDLNRVLDEHHLALHLKRLIH